MLRYLKEYNRYAEITGFKGVRFAQAEEFLKQNRIEDESGIDLQFFDAQLVASQEHLYFALVNALQAFKDRTNISKSLAMETMLFASAQRQIQKAIQLCGIKPETKNMAAILVGEDPIQLKAVLQSITRCVGVEPNEKALGMSKVKGQKIMKAFQITDQEINAVMKMGNHEEAVVNLVIERVALLSTRL